MRGEENNKFIEDDDVAKEDVLNKILYICNYLNYRNTKICMKQYLPGSYALSYAAFKRKSKKVCFRLPQNV